MAAPDLEKLEAAAIRAQRLAELPGHVGWEELQAMLREQQDLLDRNLLLQAKTGALTERDLVRYEELSRYIKIFSGKPERAQEKLENLLKKIERAQPDEGDA